jgi:hypothetical protein
VTRAGAFHDPRLPRGYNPFGIQTLHDMVFVANFGDGKINAYRLDSHHWRPDSQLKDAHRKPIVIDGLWAIGFGGGTTKNGHTNDLFFTAGPNGEADGAFGTITVAP